MGTSLQAASTRDCASPCRRASNATFLRLTASFFLRSCDFSCGFCVGAPSAVVRDPGTCGTENHYDQPGANTSPENIDTCTELFSALAMTCEEHFGFGDPYQGL